MRKAIVFVVAAEPAVVRWTRGELMREGFTVLTAASLSEAIERMRGELCDLILTIGYEMNDPEYTRLEMASIAPILPSPDSWESSLPGELLDAVYRMLPRRFQAAGKVLDYGDLVIEPGTGRVLERGYPVTLRQPEHRLLMALAGNAGETMTTDELILIVWGESYRGRLQLLRTTVSRLRDQLEIKRRLPKVITTVPGRGYRLELPESIASRNQLSGG